MSYLSSSLMIHSFLVFICFSRAWVASQRQQLKYYFPPDAFESDYHHRLSLSCWRSPVVKKDGCSSGYMLLVLWSRPQRGWVHDDPLYETCMLKPSNQSLSVSHETETRRMTPVLHLGLRQVVLEQVWQQTCFVYPPFFPKPGTKTRLSRMKVFTSF